VRSFSILALIGFLALCPLICGAGEIGHPSHQLGSSDSPSPSHCPEEGDNCICQGAVQGDHFRVPDLGSEAIGPFLFLDRSNDLLLHPLAHLTSDGSPTGLAGWGDAHAVRAFLQNYRC
jgi:hypothetical protein